MYHRSLFFPICHKRVGRAAQWRGMWAICRDGTHSDERDKKLFCLFAAGGGESSHPSSQAEKQPFRPVSQRKMAGGSAIQAARMFTKTGQASRVSVTKEITIGLVLGFAAGAMFKVRGAREENGVSQPHFPFARVCGGHAGTCRPRPSANRGARTSRASLAGAAKTVAPSKALVSAVDAGAARRCDAQPTRKKKTRKKNAHRTPHPSLKTHPDPDRANSPGTGTNGARLRSTTNRWRPRSETKRGFWPSLLIGRERGCCVVSPRQRIATLALPPSVSFLVVLCERGVCACGCVCVGG